MLNCQHLIGTIYHENTQDDAAIAIYQQCPLWPSSNL